jgi:hypothetical protein
VVALPAPTAAELAALQVANTSVKSATAGAATNKGRPLAIGFGRAVPVTDRTIGGADLSWQPLPDGGRAARIDIASEGAAAIRIALSMPDTDPAVSIRFAGSTDDTAVFGPYPANAIAEATARDGEYWSPVIQGSTATVEIYLPSGIATNSVGFTLAGISHLVVGGEGLRKVDPIAGTGKSEACEIDVACVAQQTPALVNAAKSVARITFVEFGVSYLCSGTLVNDSVSSMTPYFYTAAHCMTSQYAARTLNLFFFYDAITCGSKVNPPYAQMTGGGTLLGRSWDWDWALLRLNGTPPNGVFLAAWNADPLMPATEAIVLHHPDGDVKKWSLGRTLGFSSILNGSTMTRVIYSQGSTESGSSGAPLMTYNSAFGGYYEVRGGLYGGDASCTNIGGTNYFSRLDNALPLLRQYLTPDAPNSRAVAPAVEFYNAVLRLYFLTADPSEINDLDTGVHLDWVRTGERFLVYTDPDLAPADASPVCRVYEKPGFHGRALLFGESRGMRGHHPEVRRPLDIRERERVLHPDAQPGDGAMPREHQAGMALSQQIRRQPSIHHGDRDPQRHGEGPFSLDGGGLRPGAVLPDHVHAGSIAFGMPAPSGERQARSVGYAHEPDAA